MVGEGVEVRELPKLLLLINPVPGNPLVRPDVEDPPFIASISLVNSCLQNKYIIQLLIKENCIPWPYMHDHYDTDCVM